MIACISSAGINAEEMLNTLKYAYRARNIQNKPIKTCVYFNDKESSEIVGTNGSSPGSQMSEKSLQRWLDQELEVMVHVHEVRNEYEKQSQLATTLSPNARQARIESLESMVTISSSTLVAMASQLSEAEERDRSFSGRGCWNKLRSMGEAKSLLQYIFNVAADARCQVREKEMEIKEMKEQMTELVGILRHSEARRREMEKQLKQKEQTVAMALATPSPGNGNGSAKHFTDESNTPLSPVAVPAQKQLKYSAGIVNSPSKGTEAFNKQQLKMVPIGQLPSGKKLSVAGQSGKLWRWKRSHHQWLLQFKWKWQKPWRLSELIRHSDEMITRARPRPQLLPRKVI